MLVVLPEALIPLYLRATRANAPFLSPESADRAVRDAELRPQPYGPPSRLRPGVHVSVEHVGVGRGTDRPVYTVAPARGTPTGAVVYTHGGGWHHEISAQHWSLIAQTAAEANVAVSVPIYSLLPFGHAQDAHDLVLRCALQLIEQHGGVVLVGDSAGGQISLSVAQTLRDRGVVAQRTVLISPALDLTFSHPDIPLVQPKDPWLAPGGGRELGRRWAGDLEVRDPVVSPLFGRFEGLGPMLVFSGSRDVLNPDAHVLLERARAAGVDITLSERAGALHVFPLLPTRSGRTARAEIVAALRS
ncbi:alpha/beta hydrolase fold domain-containing protein [Kineococcus sp. T13]|nr:alpha/beta hydrolase fold domain-containing protein [Kineococcus vitellinus]